MKRFYCFYFRHHDGIPVNEVFDIRLTIGRKHLGFGIKHKDSLR